MKNKHAEKEARFLLEKGYFCLAEKLIRNFQLEIDENKIEFGFVITDNFVEHFTEEINDRKVFWKTSSGSGYVYAPYVPLQITPTFFDEEEQKRTEEFMNKQIEEIIDWENEEE